MRQMSEVAQNLLDSLKGEGAMTGSNTDLDAWNDEEVDEPGMPLHGSMMIESGKYAKTKTLAEAYVTDKPYMQWVRKNVHQDRSAAGMKKLRLYVELRDQVKTDRINMTMARPAEGNQRPVLPVRAKAKAKSAASAPSTVTSAAPPVTTGGQRRPREGGGWLRQENPTFLDMEVQEWEQVTNDPDATDELQGEWINMISTVTDPERLEMMRHVLRVMGIKTAVDMFRAVDDW